MVLDSVCKQIYYYMKKVLLIVAVSVMSFMAGAQHVNFGIKGGGNLSSVSGNDYDYKSTGGLAAGLLAHIHLNRQFAIQPEAYYSGQGAKYSTLLSKDNELKLNYVNVPVLLQFMFDNGFRLQTGPQVGFLTSAKVKSGGNSADVSNNIKPIDFSWPAGIGYISPSGFGADVRYNIGLSDISKASNTSLKNNVLSFTLFYQFRHK